MKGDMTIVLDKNDYNKFMAILGSMDKVDQKPEIRRALSDGVQVIIATGKSNLAQRNKVKTGNLKKSFKKSIQTKKTSAYAGFIRPKGAHSHLVDRGTKKRYTKSGYYRGSAKGTLFWTDAVQTKGQEAMSKLMDAIYKSLDNITSRR